MNRSAQQKVFEAFAPLGNDRQKRNQERLYILTFYLKTICLECFCC